MEVKRVKCSNCGIILEVKNSKNEAVKLITCPQCIGGKVRILQEKSHTGHACKDCIYRSRSHVPHWKRDDDD